MDSPPAPFTCRQCGQMTAVCIGNDAPDARDPDECPVSAAQPGANVIHCPCGTHRCARCFAGMYGGGTRDEALRLFEPAPNVIPGQLAL